MLSILISCGGSSGTPPLNNPAQKLTYSSGVITISGSNFGNKPTAAPAYFSTFDNEATGQIPSGQITNTTNRGLVKQNIARGLKSLEYDYCADYGIIVFSPNNSHYLPNYIIRYNNRLYTVIADVRTDAINTPDVDVTHYRYDYDIYDFSVGKNYQVNNCIKYGGRYYTAIVQVSSSSTTPNNDLIHYRPGPPAAHCSSGDTANSGARNAIDLGSTTNPDSVYVSFWLYLDKAITTSSSWQWKSVFITSSDNLYVNTNPDENSTWINSWYSGTWNLISNVYAGSTSLPIPYGNPANAYLWGQWQRVEYYAQRSSAGGVADGIWRGSRIGNSVVTFNHTDAITHQVGAKPWRYVDLSNEIESVYDGYVDLKVYMDDVYVDTSQARVEICDTPTWATRTHCEIQKPISWSPAEVKATLNQGSFISGEKVFFYVIDKVGTVIPIEDSFVIP